MDYPLEELVLLTDQYATTSARIHGVHHSDRYILFPSLIGDYMSDVSMITNAQAINAPFKDDRTLDMLAIHNDFFPSEYLASESVEGIFGGSHVEDFDDFDNFRYV